MAIATRELAKRTRPSDRIRKKRDTDPAQEGDADYGMREHHFRFFSELDADPDGWLQIFPMGKYTYSDLGEIEITPERCANFVKNFDDNARGHALPVNREHVAELGAVGWFKELAKRDDGVWAKIDWTDDGKDLLEAKAFKFFSPEFYDEYPDPKTGETYHDLLVGCAITNYPRFFDMTPVAANERVAAAMKKAADSFEERIEAVRESLQSLYGWDIWPEETLEDRAIVRWMDAWWSFPYTIAADGDISLGIPTEVERTFTPATAASERQAKKSRLHKEAAMAIEKPGAVAEKPGAGKTPITPSEPVAASEGVVIQASELATLREQAAQAPAAMAEAKRANAALRLMAANDVLEAAKRAGRIVPSEEDFWRTDLIAASDERFATVKKYLAEKPVILKLGAIGSGEAVLADDVTRRQLHERAEKYMAEHKGVEYKDALLAVDKEGK